MGLFKFKKESAKPEKVENGASDSVKRDIPSFNPRSFDDVAVIIDCLMTGSAAIVDLSDVRNDTAQRALDLLSGAIYALGGNMGEIRKDAYIFTPKR